MLELLFLLLPVAAAYGWYMGRRSARLDSQQSSHKLSRNYVAGINFLLSEQPDKAVDLFIELLQVDDETLETHLALGNLFRQRGEVDRAIRIHQNLVARPSLTFEQRNLSMLELARDFIAAGLLDRAETILAELVRHDEHEEEAATLLISVYQQLRDWEKAIAIAIRSRKKLGENILPPLANFYCELAAQESGSKKSISYLKKALSVDSRCTRASLALAEIYILEDEKKLAVETLVVIGHQDPDFVSEALPLLKRCFAASDPQYKAILLQWLEQSSATSIALALADVIYAEQGTVEAEQHILKELKRNPTMRAFSRLMDYRLVDLDSTQAKESISLLKSLVEKQISLKPSYRCQQCGFSTKIIFWQCPSCKRWASIKPIRGLDGE
jgi:lipopolysaccharide assembly protein B